MSFFQKILKINNLNYRNNKDALEQVFNAYSFYGDEKHKFNNSLIEDKKDSINPDDILAVAISCENEGASYRKQAISFFEKYLKNPSQQTFFSEWNIYSMLATLYEKEYQFDNAIQCLEKLVSIDGSTDSSDYISADYRRIGNVLLKKDVNLAVTFYKNLLKQDIDKKTYNLYKEEYEKMLEKQQKGFKFKPRNKV